MRNKILSVFAALSLALGLVAVGATSAQATHPQVSGSYVCNTATGLYDVTWTVTGDPGYPNVSGTFTSATRAESQIVGKTVQGGGAVIATETVSGKQTLHLTVGIQFDNHAPGDIVTNKGQVVINKNCSITPTEVPVPTLTVAPPTCDAAGYIPLLNESTGPAQNPNGYEFLGRGYRLYLNPGFTGAGTYTATFQKVGAGFDPAFPGGTKVTGQTTQVVTVLPATGYQTADPSAPCFNRPEVPTKDPKVVVTEEQPRCETRDVPVTTSTTVYTYTWNETTKSYDETATTTDVYTYRPLTDAEFLDCFPQPENKVTYSEWVDGEFECGDTEVEQTRERTETPFILVDRVWVEDTANAVTTTEERERALEADEIEVCPTTPPTEPPVDEQLPPTNSLPLTGAGDATPMLVAAWLAVTLGLSLIAAGFVRRRQTA